MLKIPSQKRARSRFSIHFIKRLSSWLVLSTALTVAVRSASSLYWDSDADPLGNNADGTELGGPGSWDTGSNTWWNGVDANSTWNNAGLDTAIFAGTPGAVTIEEPIIAGKLVFNTSGYSVRSGLAPGSTLQLAGPATVEVLRIQDRAEIAAAVKGSAGLTKTGNGTLVLTNTANSYTGNTVVNNGRLVVSDEGQLGDSETTVSVGGLAGFGQMGGTLFLDGGIEGMTLERDLSLAGRGPNTVSAALISAGNNVLNGALTTSSNTETRMVSLYGTTTLNGQVTLGSGQTSLFIGNGNWIINGQVTSTGTNTGTLYKSGNSVATTIVLANNDNDFQQQVRIDSGTIRVAHGGALGTNTSTATVRGSGGTLEIRAASADVGTFSKINLLMDGSLTVFVDRAVGGYDDLVNQTVQMGEFRFNGTNRTLTVNGRNGYGLSLGMADPAASLGGNGGGNTAFTNNSDGLVTLQGTVQVGDNTARTFTITTNGNVVFSGRVNSNGTGAHNFTKAGQGHLLLSQGSAFFDANGSSNYTGNTSITDGTLSLRTIRAINEGGGSLFLSNGAINFIGDEGTGAGEEWTKTINLNSAQPIILANQTGSAPTALIISSTFEANNASAKTLYLGGENALDNTITSVIINNTAATSLLKSGSGTWVLSGDNGGAANGFTGTLTVSGGTLKVADTFDGASRNVIKDTVTVAFGVDALRRNQYAGGTFEYVGAAGAASSENVGMLGLDSGMGTVRVTPGAGGTATLIFSSYDSSVGRGASVNFELGTGAKVTLTGRAEGYINARTYVNGADFAYYDLAQGTVRAPIYGTDANFVTTLGTASTHVLLASDAPLASDLALRTLKLTGATTLTLEAGVTLTVSPATNSSGGILADSGTTMIRGGAGITSGGGGELDIMVNGATDILTLETPITSTTTGGLTKNGAGTLVLAGLNSQTDTTSINEGTVRLSGVGRLSADNQALVIRQNGVLDLNGSATGVIAGSFNGAGRVINSGAGASTLSIGNGVTTNGSAGTFSGTIEGAISVNLTTSNNIAGQTTTFGFSGLNTYTGATTLSKTTAGNLVLQVNNLADIGFASGIGAGDATSDATNAASLVFNGGTLQYVGATTLIYDIDGAPSVSTNRLFTLAGDGAIDSSPTRGNETGSGGSANHASLIFRHTGPVVFSGAGARTLTLQGNSQGDNLINLQLVNNGADPLSVTKSGSGLWILGNAANTYTGATTISGGVLQAQDGTSLSAGSNLTLSGGVFQTFGLFDRTLGTGAGQLQITGGTSGFAASTAPLTVSLDGGAPLVWGSGSFAPGTLALNSTTALFDVHLTNDIDLGASTRTIFVDDNTTTGLDFATVSGDLSSSTATTGLIKTGNGTLYLVGDNSYTGDTSINAGAVFVTKFGGSTGTSSLGTGGALNLGAGTATTAVIYIGDGEISDRAINLAGSTGTRRIDASGFGPLVLTGAFTNGATGAVTLELRGYNPDANEFTGNLADGGGALSVTKTDGGTWILSGNNTFTGNLTISSGNLGFTHSNALGAADAGAIILSNGGLFAVGGAQTITREVRFNNNATSVFTGAHAISIGTAEAPVDVIGTNGSGTSVSVNNTITDPAGLTVHGDFLNLDASNSTTVTLNFQGTGATTWNGVIRANETVGTNRLTGVNFTAAPEASLTLAGDSPNTFDGPMTLGQGTLILAKEGALGTGTFAFNGGVLRTTLDGGVTITNTVAMNSGNPAAVAGSENITFAGNLTMGGSRTLENYLDPGQTLTIAGLITNTITSGATLAIAGTGDTLISGNVGTGSGNQGLNFLGTGTLTLTGDNTMTGTLTVNNGLVVLSDAGAVNEGAVNVVANGVLRLDNSAGNAAGGRLDGSNVTITGGTFEFIGNAAGSSETAGTLSISTYAGRILMSGGGPNTLTFGTFATGSTGSFLDLGGISDLGGANRILFTTAPAMSNGILAKVGVGGADFATYDATNGLVAFTGYDTSNDFNTALPTATMRITGDATVTGTRVINALAIDGDGLTVSGGGTARTLTLSSGGLLVTGGDNTLSTPILAFGTTGVIQIDTGSSLEVTGSLLGTGGFAKALGGVLTLSSRNYLTSTQNISGGTLVLNGGTNTIYQNQLLSLGGPDTVLDLNGNSQYFAHMVSPGSVPDSGGTIISTGGPAVLLSNGAAGGSTFTGRIRGDITFARVGGNSHSFTSDQDYTGATIIGGGTVTLRDDARLSATSSIDLNYGVLALDNNSNLRTNLTDRVKDTAPITMRGGTLSFVGRTLSASTETFGNLTLAQGANTVTVTTGNSGAYFSAQATFADLVRTAGTTINFTTGANTLGAVGNNPRILFAAAPETVGDGLLGAWAIVNSTDYAVYDPTNGIGAMNVGGRPAYDTTFASGHATNIGANVLTSPLTTVLTGDTTTGMLRIAGAVPHDVVFTNGDDVLNLEMGGLLRSNNNNEASLGTAEVRGVLTAGGNALSGNTELVIYHAQNRLAIHSTIVDTQTATGAGTGTVSLVKSGNGVLALSAPNTYTGGTTVNQGTLSLEGGFGTVVLPSGGLTLNGATVTMIDGEGQIDASNVVTLNGSSTLNLVGFNMLDSLVFNNVGGTTAPTVNTDGFLSLTNVNAITVTSSNPSTVPVINGFLDFMDTTRTIQVGAIQVAGETITDLTASLNITAAISGFGAGIIKTGDGLLQLSGQSNFFGGVNVTAGGLIIGANSTPTTAATGAVDSSPLGLGTLVMADGTSLFVDNASRTVANRVEFEGNAIFNNTGTSTVTMTLNGPISLIDGPVSMTVVTPNFTTTLGGAIGASATDIVKEGLGTLILGNRSNAFTGKIIVNGGMLLVANDGALGVAPGAFLQDAITLNEGGAFGSSATTVLGDNRGITLNNGGTLHANSGSILTIHSPVAGTGGLVVTGTGTGQVKLFGDNTFTGGITVSSGTLLLAGTNSITEPVYVLPGGTLALANDNTGLNGQPLFVNSGSIGLFWDGDGRGTRETYAFPTVTPPANIIGNFGIAVNRIGETAANKTIRYNLSDLPVITNQTITITNSNGYGLELMGDLTLGAGGGRPTFTVTNATGSNVVQGLTLNGQISGTQGFNKLGNGTLVLGNETNDFVGDIDIRRGVVSVDSNGALGNAANVVRFNNEAVTTTGNTTLDGTTITVGSTSNLLVGASVFGANIPDNAVIVSIASGNRIVISAPATAAANGSTLTFSNPAAFRVTEDVTTARSFQFVAAGGVATAANALFEVADGKTLTLNSPFDTTLNTTAVVAKRDNGTLILNAANAGWNGSLIVNGGAVVLTNGNAAGSGAISISSSFTAALQLAGVTLGNTINLQSNTNSPFAGIQGQGSVQAISGVNHLNGTLNITFDSVIGAAEGAVLNINGSIVPGTTMRQMIFTGGGDIVINSVLPQFHTLNKRGSGTLTITSANDAATTSGGLRVQSGELILRDGGTYTGAVQGITVASGAALSLIDTGTPVANRLGGRTMTLTGGTFNYTISDTAASVETGGGLWFGIGGSEVNVINTGAQTGTLTFTGLSLSAGSAVNFTGALGGANKILFTSPPAMVPAGNGIIARALINGADFATYEAATGLTAFTGYNFSNDLDAALATDVVSLSASSSITNSRTLAALKIDGSNIVIGGASGTALTLTSGGILVTGSNNTLSVPVVTLGTEGLFHIVDGASLSVDSALTGSAGMNKADGGTLTLNSINFATGTNYVTGGTLVLNGGTNTLNANGALSVGLEATVDLRGNAQWVNTLSTSGLGFTHNGGTGAATLGGVITTTDGPATLVTNVGATGTFAGSITGGITFGRTGGSTLTLSNNNTYTGKTILNGGTTTLLGDGRISGTAAIEINNANLTLNNQGEIFHGDRVNDAAAIRMHAGTISFLGRQQTNNTETFGAVTLAGGLSTINAGLGGTGINSVKLTLADLIRSNPDAMINFSGSNLGLIGSTSQIKVSTYAANIDFVGPWAIVNGTEYAAYDVNYGFGALNATGFVGYDGTALPTASAPTHNIRLTAGDYAVGGATTIHTLNLNGNVNLAFDVDSDVLNLVGGGLLKSGAFGNTIGAYSGNGNITAGGADAATLFIYNQQNNLFINSSIVDNSGGAVRLVLGGGGVIQLEGFNSYTGGTVVNGGTVTVANLLPNGGVTVNNGILTTGAGDGLTGGIGAGNVVTLNAGVLNLNMNNTLNGLILNSNGATATTVNTGGVLTLTGDIESTPTSVSNIATINGFLDFAGATRTIEVDATRVDGRDVAPWLAGLNITAEITNGGILKTGAGVLQLNSTASTFAGGVDLQEGSLIIGANSTPTSGAGPVLSGPLGTGTLTVGSGTTLLSTGNIAISNAVVINGDFTFAGATNLQLNGPITLNQLIGDPTQISITVVHPVMTATLGGDITGTVTNINKLGLGTLVVNPNYSGSLTSNGGALSLLSDGDGTSGLQDIQFGNITLNAPTTLNVGRLGTEQLPNYTLAANKTIVIANVTTNGHALTVNNLSGGTGAGNGGYGLEVTGNATLNSDQTYVVTTATGSNVVQGLTLSGVLSGPGGIIKRGNGTLVLGNENNSFGGGLIDIQAGVVSVADDGALGAASNIVRFNSATFEGTANTATNSSTVTVSSTAGLVVGASVIGPGIPANAVITSISGTTTFVISAPATATAVGASLTFANPTTFRATDDIETSRQFQFVAEAGSGVVGADALFEVVGGKTLTLNSAFNLALNAAGNVAKGDNGTLVLNGNNAAWNGILTINAGVVQLGQTSALGSAAGETLVRNTGAALQLTNGLTIAEPLTLIGSGIESRGALQSSGALANTVSGAITLGGAATIGADAGNTLNLTGGIAGSETVTLAATGDINIRTNAIGDVDSVVKTGAGTAALEVASPAYDGTLVINDGTFAIRGEGRTGGSGTITLGSAGTLRIDNSGTNIVDRLGGGTRRNVSSIGGTIAFIGHASEVSAETFGTLTLGSRGLTAIQITAGATGQANLRFGALTRNERTSLLVESNALSSTAGAGNATLSFGGSISTAGTGATGSRTKTVLPWAIVHDTVTDTYAFAARDGEFLRALGGLGSGEVVNTLTSGANIFVDNTLATSGNISFNSLTLAAGSSLTINGRTTLTLGTSNSLGGILALEGSSTIGGNANGTGVINTGNNAELLIHAVGDLTIGSTIGASSGGWTKSGKGTLTLDQEVIRTGNQAINDGTVRLNGGNNTLRFNQNMLLTDGGVLDLYGNSQHFAILQTDGAPVANRGGVVTNTHADNATLVINNDNAARNWAGRITNEAGAGTLSFLRAGQNTLSFYSDNDYSGITQLSGGTTLLRDEGRLSATTAIDINYAALTLDNLGGAIDLNDRVNDAAAITLRGGNITFQGRAQTNSTETLGAITLAGGYSTILSTAGGTGINSAELTLASLTQGSTDAVVNFNGSGGGGQLGQIGSNPRIFIAEEPVLVNNIIGGWAIINGQEFASYSADFGVGSLTQTGFAGYDVNLATSFVPNDILATDNVRVTTSFALPSAGLTVNSLSLRGTFDTNFNSADALLNVVSGGIILNRSNSRMGNTVDDGRLTAGGSQSTGTANLYLYNTANTYTVNSRIVDNPNGAKVRLVLSASGGAITLTNPFNSETGEFGGLRGYTGGTVVNGGTVNLATPFEGFGAVIPFGDDGLTINGATVTMRDFAGQIDAGNIVTLNGSSILNLIGNNTLAGLVFNTTGTGTSVITPTVNTGTDGTGILTLNGDIYSNPSTVTTTATVFGRMDFGNVQRTITVEPITFNGEDVSPLLSGFSLQGLINSTGGFVKEGAGVLQFNGQTLYTGATVVNEGTIQIGSVNAGSRYSDYTLNAGTRLNLNGQNTILGSLAGSGTVINSGGATTLTVGFNDASTTFSGQLDRYSDAVLNSVSLAKIGSGTLTLTGQASANVSSGTLTVSEGEVAYAAGGTAALLTHLVQTGGTLTLDNSGANTNDRLQGTTLNIGGGTVHLRGNAGVATTETVNTLTISSGTGELLLDPAGQAVTFTPNVLSAVQAGGTLVLRSLPGASFKVTTLNQPGSQGTGANGTTTMLIRPDIIGDSSAHALADLDSTTAFVTRDSVTQNLRPLTAAEMETVLSNSATTNFSLNADATFAANQSANSLRFENGVTLTSLVDGNPASTLANGVPLTQTVTTGGMLALSGDTVLNFGRLATSNNTPFYFYTLDSSSITVNAALNVSSGGLIKSGDGALTLNEVAYYTGATAINGGRMTLNAGDNTIRVIAGSGGATLSALHANNGVLDLNGNDQAFGTLSSNNPLPNTGGTITNSAGGEAVDFVTSTGTSIFGGNITGNLNFIKTGNSTLTLTSASSYTGETIVRGNTLTLRDEGSLLNTSGVSLFFANLTLDNVGMTTSDMLNPQRLMEDVPLTLRGGTLTLNGAGSSHSDFAFDEVTMEQGSNTINLAPGVNSGANSILTIGNLVREFGATVHFTNSLSTGTLGDASYNGAQILLNQINGVAPANGGFLGSWAIVNSGDFAAYIDGRGVARYGQAGFPGYGSTFASGVIRNVSANTTIGTANSPGTILVGALRISGGGTVTLSFANATDLLNIEFGGLLSSNEAGARVIGSTGTRGILTAGGFASSGVVELVVGKNQSTTTIHSVITDNPNGAAVALVKTLAGALTLTANNTFTGGVIVDQGTLTLAATTAGSIVLPGDLTINNATVTMSTHAQQIAATSDVRFNGGGTLTLVGSNTLNSITWNNLGGTSNPTVNTGSGVLTLTSTNGLTANSDNFATSPLLAGNWFLGTDVFQTITTTGSAPNSLTISAAITGDGNSGLVKQGAGGLMLSNSGGNAWTGETTIAEGTLRLGSTTALPSASLLVISPNGILDVNGQVLSRVAGSLSGSGTVTNTANATATLNFGGDDRSETFDGVITNGASNLNLTKNGVGVQTLTGANSYTGTTTVTRGVLRIANDFALGTAAGGTTVSGDTATGTLELSNDITVTGEVLTLSARQGAAIDAAHVRNVSGNNEWAGDINFTTGGSSYNLDSEAGLLTISGQISGAATPNGRSLRLRGAGDGLVSGNIVNGTAIVSLTKRGAGTWTLSGTGNTYTGATTVDEGKLVVSGTLSGTADVNVGGAVNPAVLTATGTLTSPTFDVRSSGTLNGTGIVNGAVTVENGGTLAPGAGLAGLTIDTGSLDFSAGSTFALSLANTNGAGQPLTGDYSKLTLGTGIAADLNGTIVTNVSGSLNAYDLFTVILTGTATNGFFSNTTAVSGSTHTFISGGYEFLINYAFDAGTFDGSLASFEASTGGTNVALLVVPEPTALSMLAGSFGLALGLQRFRRRR